MSRTRHAAKAGRPARSWYEWRVELRPEGGGPSKPWDLPLPTKPEAIRFAREWHAAQIDPDFWEVFVLRVRCQVQLTMVVP